MQECLVRSDLALELFGVPITDTWSGGGGGAVFVYPRSARKPFHVIIGVPISPIRNYKQLHFSVCNCCGLFIAGVKTVALRVEKLRLLFCRTGLFLFIYFSFLLLFYFAHLHEPRTGAKNY